MKIAATPPWRPRRELPSGRAAWAVGALLTIITTLDVATAALRRQQGPAPRPPMRWNSFDADDCRIDEAEFRRNADVLAAKLLPHGWEYAVVDYIWFNPSPGNWNNPNRRKGHPDLRLDDDGQTLDKLTIDAHGRLFPAVERFPSATGGKGFGPFVAPNHWPDADMPPIGRLSLQDRSHGPERGSQFTWDEHATLITLWCVARSPLIMGGDLLTSSERTLSYLTNDEVLQVDQNSTDNRQVFFRNNKACWIAKDLMTGERFLALFSLGQDIADVAFDFELEAIRGAYNVRDLWSGKQLVVHARQFSVKLPAHGAGLYRMSCNRNDSGGQVETEIARQSWTGRADTDFYLY